MCDGICHCHFLTLTLIYWYVFHILETVKDTVHLKIKTLLDVTLCCWISSTLTFRVWHVSQTWVFSNITVRTSDLAVYKYSPAPRCPCGVHVSILYTALHPSRHIVSCSTILLVWVFTETGVSTLVWCLWNPAPPCIKMNPIGCQHMIQTSYSWLQPILMSQCNPLVTQHISHFWSSHV